MKFFLSTLLTSLLYFLVSHKVSLAQSPDSPNLDIEQITNTATQKVENYSKSLQREKYEYEIWVIKYNKKLYEYQHFSSKILLGISIIVLTCGLYFSYIQFKNKTTIHNITIKNKQDPENKEEFLEQDDDSKTSLKIGATGIEISSSIIGLLILCVSLAFFYLYIANIYPIESSENGGKGKLPESILMDSTPSPSVEPKPSPD